ncbi:membrane protein [Roseibium aquae]|uniref:Membrane protein n=1 Tax=Roseibium aquae TaxID=1323746 RepID=A0A916TC95_9HYPH|nr:DMT family transporter [Roseibium aquae]GGB37913.1 membrane protein [Roseibium aquae]
MMLYEAAALGAATCWALTGLISAGPSAALGALAFNRLRMSLVFIVLALYVATVTGLDALPRDIALPLALSGLIGIFLGDTALFLTLNRLGPRRTAMVFSLNAPISAILGFVFLRETLTPLQIAGILVTFAGVILAIRFGKRKSQLHQWENVKGPLWIGIAIGLIAALSQSAGSLIARPVMETGTDPIAASAIRVGTAALCLWLLFLVPHRQFKPAGPVTLKLAGIVGLSGFLGMGVGMTLLLFALSGGEVGVVATLSATTPAILLPLIWWRTKEMPAPGAWVGAGLVLVGSALLFAV